MPTERCSTGHIYTHLGIEQRAAFDRDDALFRCLEPRDAAAKVVVLPQPTARAA